MKKIIYLIEIKKDCYDLVNTRKQAFEIAKAIKGSITKGYLNAEGDVWKTEVIKGDKKLWKNSH